MSNATIIPPYAALDAQAQVAGFAETPLAGNDRLRLPQVLLPGGSQTITAAAEQLGSLLAPTHTLFNRGGYVVAIRLDDSGHPIIEPVSAAALASRFEIVAQLAAERASRGGPQLQSSVCTEQIARVIGACPAFIEALPPLRAVSSCPVLVADEQGGLRQVCGYDRQHGVYAGGTVVPDMPLERARELLVELFDDYRFSSEGDRARALAAIITPAMVQGQLLHARVPMDLGEADDSQAGKGYRNKLTAAIYGQLVYTVTQKNRGVGGLEESLNRHLINGRTFIALDNVRGAIDSPALESLLTEDTYSARALRSDAVIDPRRVIIQFTSNRAEVTADLAKRSSCVRILKQAPGYAFRVYPEGDVLDHVRANQPLYLGAVFTIIRGWWAAGQKTTGEVRHDYRTWARTLDWICQHLLGTGPLLDGHVVVQQRIRSPHLVWLRSLALEVFRANRGGFWLTTTNLVDIAANSGSVEISSPESMGFSDGSGKSMAALFGRRLKSCFADATTSIELDEFTVERTQEQQQRAYSWQGGPMTVNSYRFSRGSGSEDVAPSESNTPATPGVIQGLREAAPEAAPRRDFDRKGFLVNKPVTPSSS